MNKKNRTKFLTRLNSGEVKFEFTKLNGQNRKMRATRSPKLIPKNHHPKSWTSGDIDPTEIQDIIDNDTLAVYDLDAKGWRSFSFDSVITD